MQKYTDTVQNRLGMAVEGAKVLVTDINGSVATIFSNNGTTQQSNPMTTDANGCFAFYAADGRYNLTITINNVQYGEQRDILLNDPADPSPEKIDGGVIVNSQVNESELNDCTITGGTAKQVTVTGSTISQSELEDVTIDGLPPMTVGGHEHQALVHEHQALVQEDQQLTAQSREALRRSYADAGFTLIDGSFEEGGTLTSSSDVLLHKASVKAYSWTGAYPVGGYVVAPGTDPTAVTGYVPRTDVVLRSELASPGGAGLVGGTIPVITDPKFAGGGIGDGVTNNGPMFVAASQYVGDGGSVLLPPGRWRIAGNFQVRPVNFIGSGQGATVIEFDMTLGKFDGLVFAAPTKPQVGFGITNATIKVIGGRGGNAIITPTDSFVGLFPKPKFEHLSFCSDSANDAAEGFAQAYSWDWMFLLGDAMLLTLHGIDALGSYKPSVNPTLQNIDGFMRAIATQGILSMRCSNITTHNVGKFFEIRSKAYFSMHNIDVARAWTGFTDAPDRVFEPNRYGYGESNLNFVVINAQKACFDLKNRFFSTLSNVAVHRAHNAFDHGGEWVGIRYDDGETNLMVNLEIGYPTTGYSGPAIGLDLAGGVSNLVSNLSLGGPMTSAVRLKGRSLDGAANQGTIINGITTHAGVSGTLFDLVEARGARITGFTKLSSVTNGTFVTYGNSSTQQSCFFSQCPTDNTQEFDDDLLWVRASGGTDAKRWRWNASDSALILATQGDSFAVGNNALLISRTGLLIDKIELRTRSTAGAYSLLNTPETQFAGFIKPTVTNAYTVGTAAFAWSGGFTQTAFTVTSDERCKTPPVDITDAMLDAAAEVDWCMFQYLDRVEEKGIDGARWHFGAIAQRFVEAFQKHGLDPFRFAFICYDEWDAKDEVVGDDGEIVSEAVSSGSRYGIRYEQAIILKQRQIERDHNRRIDALLSRIEALEDK